MKNRKKKIMRNESLKLEKQPTFLLEIFSIKSEWREYVF